MARSPLVGLAYQARSRNLSSQRLINLYLESMEVPGGAEPNCLLACPGTVTALTLATGVWRACEVQNGVMYVIVGNSCYAVSGSPLAGVLIGTLSTFTGPAYIEFNDVQAGFFDSAGLTVVPLAGGAAVTVTLPFAGTVGVPASLDTLTVLTQPGTYNLWQCDPNDMTTWDALNFTTEDGNAEPVVAVATLHDTIVVLKTGSMCFYVNQGNSGFVFGRLDGIYPRTGCAAASTVKKLGELLLWLGQTQQGGPQVYMLEGYGPRPVSTYAIDNTIQNYATVADAFALAYTQQGHPFYVLTFPTGNQTFVFDPKETAALKANAWHERAGFLAGSFIAYAGRCACQFSGQVYMGDNISGRLYQLNLNNFQDNGATRKWLRSWRASPAQAQYATEKCNYLDIAMDTGLGIPPGTNPQLVLRQSFDGGNSWSAERYQSAGQTGETLNSVHFPRLGSTRRGLNSDRTFELSSTDVFFASLLGADIG